MESQVTVVAECVAGLAPRDPPAAASVRDSEVISSIDAGLISQTAETIGKTYTGDDFEKEVLLHTELISKSEVIDTTSLEPQVVTVAAERVAGLAPRDLPSGENEEDY